MLSKQAQALDALHDTLHAEDRAIRRSVILGLAWLDKERVCFRFFCASNSPDIF